MEEWKSGQAMGSHHSYTLLGPKPRQYNRHHSDPVFRSSGKYRGSRFSSSPFVESAANKVPEIRDNVAYIRHGARLADVGERGHREPEKA